MTEQLCYRVAAKRQIRLEFNKRRRSPTSQVCVSFCSWALRYSARDVQEAAQQQKAGEHAKEPLMSAKGLERARQMPLQGADLRLIYLSHLLTPFSLAPVWDTALKLQTLFLTPPPPSSWEPAAVGVSLRVRQALKTPRAWILLLLGILDTCACGLLLALWRLSIPQGPAIRLELTTVFAGLFGMLTPAFWGAFTSTSSSFAAAVLNQTLGAVACACEAAAPSQGPGFSSVGLALFFSFFVGTTSTLPRFVAIAFGPHRMAFLLFGFACLCLLFGLSIAAGVAEALLRIPHGIEFAFAGASSLLAASSMAFLVARCYRRRLGRILDLPSAYHLRFEDSGEGDDESGKPLAFLFALGRNYGISLLH